MTTILVTKDNDMLADSIITSGCFIIQYDVHKIESINGSLVGVAGSWDSCMAFKEWYENLCEAKEAIKTYPGLNIKPPKIKGEEDQDFQALVLSPDGTLMLFEDNNVPYEVEKPYAIGSGGEYAICAMDAGADGMEAITIAIKRDIFSGGDIYSANIEDEELKE